MKILLVLALISFSSQSDFKSIVKERLTHNVTVTTSSNFGSGVILQDNIILTNYHLLELGSSVFVNGKKAIILSVDPEMDLLLLKSETVHVTPITLGKKTIEQTDEVFYIGNTNRHANFFSAGRVSSVDEKYIYTNTTAVGGCSGGGLYNYQGELVGLNARHEHNVIGVHITTAIIEKFLDSNREHLEIN